jgi:anaerobic ribonucleoside-triphosphate reductase activating protein
MLPVTRMSETYANPQAALETPTHFLLNLAAIRIGTRALGPGLRMGIWVQGCPFQCAGCIAPEWIPQHIHTLAAPEHLAQRLLEHPEISGLTLSGGEPMLQAAGLAELIRQVRRLRQVDVICFTGYRYETLLSAPPNPAVAGLLAQVDLLIDGPYVQRLNDGRGLRGSRNQTPHYLTQRLMGFDAANMPRRVEVYLEEEGQAFLVGIPPRGLAQAWESAQRRQP